MNTSAISLVTVSGEPTSIGSYVPGLRERFLGAPEVALALVQYEGVFGSRTIGDVVLLNWKGKYLDFDLLPADVRRVFGAVCETLLAERFPQWWEGEGAQGRFLWEIEADTLTHDHHLRVLREPDMTEGAEALPNDFDGFCDSDIPF